jgi:futalosine hydrolase
MYILLVAATQTEIAPVVQLLHQQHNRLNSHHIQVLITGIGSMHTSYRLTRSIANSRPDYLLQAGIGGSFSATCPPGSAVLVQEEMMGDVGVEENETFKDIFDMHLQEPGVAPYTGKSLVNPYCSAWQQCALPFVKGITINEITTRQQRVTQLQQKYQPVVESMEGAAFHYVALAEHVPFMQLRTVSNYVGERDKTKWKMKEAIELLNKKIVEMVNGEWSMVNGE